MNDTLLVNDVESPLTDLDIAPGDLAWHAGQGDDWHDLDEPTPLDALEDATDYDAWPEWAQQERWAPSDEPDEPEAFALPVGTDRGARRTSTRVDAAEEHTTYGR